MIRLAALAAILALTLMACSPASAPQITQAAPTPQFDYYNDWEESLAEAREGTVNWCLLTYDSYNIEPMDNEAFTECVNTALRIEDCGLITGALGGRKFDECLAWPRSQRTAAYDAYERRRWAEITGESAP